MTSGEDLSHYRPCVGIMLLNRSGQVFAGRRIYGGNERAPIGYQWQMPQGGIDEGEEPLAAAGRELHEETGVRSIRLLAEAPEWYTYDIPTALVGDSWKGRYRGQRQRWFAFRFEGDDSEIDILAAEGHEPEFEAWAWMPMADLPDLVVPFKREVYRRVIAAFGHLGAEA